MRNWDAIRHKAREMRAALGADHGALAAKELLAALLEQAGITVAPYPPDSPLLNGARAAWRADYGFIAVDATLSEPERWFAIAHELGHFALHPGSCACGDEDIDAGALPLAIPLGEGRVWGYNPRQVREIEANLFAGELLAPSDILRARFLAGETYRDLAAAFGVTTTCLLNQLLGVVLGGDDASGTRPENGGVPPLDPSQSRAARASERRVLVEAGPGTGKTSTLIARAAHLLESGIGADQILILTFSNNAAEEIHGRLRRALPAAAGTMIATFHGFALDTLRRFAPQAGLRDDFRVIDEIDATILLERSLPDLDLRHYAHLARPGLYFPAFLTAASRMRDRVLTPTSLRAYQGQDGPPDLEDASAPIAETLRLLSAYDDLLDTHNLVDYGGLITRTIHLLREQAPVAAVLRRQYRHILVDEYQDVNRASAILLQHLVDDGTGLWVVGDVRQAIFRFRGAEPANFLGFARDFPGATRLALKVNYRSVPSLVDAFASLAGKITGSTPRWEASRSPCADGGVVLARAQDGDGEYAGIVADISRSVAAGRAPQDHAVLCCTHAQAAAVAAALEEAGYPTNHLGNFLLRPEIKDMFALLEWCWGEGAALLRLVTWQEYAMEPLHAEALIQAARETHRPLSSAITDPALLAALPPSEQAALQRLAAQAEAVRYYPAPADVLLHYLFGEASYLRTLLRDGTPTGKQRASALFQLIVLARGFPRRPLIEPDDDLRRAFLRYARRLLAGRDKATFQAAAPVAGAVNVLTAHASKGLEFPVVYIPNLSKGRFPARPPRDAPIILPESLDDDRGYADDEVRNLLFVAASRARDRLVISRARQYAGKGSTESPLLHLIQTLVGVSRVEWGGGVRTPAPATSSATTPTTIADFHLRSLLRCPRQHYYAHQLGVRGSDDERSYLHFVHLLDEGLQLLRERTTGGTMPSAWSDADGIMAAWWEEHWPTAYPLKAFYGRAARRAFEAEHAELATGASPLARRGERRNVEVAGHTISVGIDCIEERADGSWFIWERASQVDDDRKSLQLALYGAAAQAEDTPVPVTVAIRYLTDGRTEAIPGAPNLLPRHPDRGRIPVVLAEAQGGAFPPAPRAEAECLHCPFVFVCPR